MVAVNKPIHAAAHPLEAGLSLIEILIAMAIAAILSVGVFTTMSAAYQNQITAHYLTQRVIQTEIMKAALNTTLANAGNADAITFSAASVPTSTPVQPFNLLGLIGNLLFGTCNTGLISGIYSDVTNFLDTLLLGQPSSTNGNTATTSSTIPPITGLNVSPDSATFGWYANNSGVPVACTGTLTITGSIMLYAVTGGTACTGNGSASAITDYPVGNGWSFSGPVSNTACMGLGFPDNAANALIAVKAAARGLSQTMVSVCVPQ